MTYLAENKASKNPPLMAPIDPWRNSTPFFGAVAFCMTNIKDFRTPLMSTSSTISSTYASHNRSSRWTSSKVKVMQVIKVDQLEDTNYERLTWAKLHSGLKPKNENVPKEDFWRKATFDRRWPLTEDDLCRKRNFDKTTFDKTKFRRRSDYCHRVVIFSIVFTFLPVLIFKDVFTFQFNSIKLSVA